MSIVRKRYRCLDCNDILEVITSDSEIIKDELAMHKPHRQSTHNTTGQRYEEVENQ